MSTHDHLAAALAVFSFLIAGCGHIDPPAPASLPFAADVPLLGCVNVDADRCHAIEAAALDGLPSARSGEATAVLIRPDAVTVEFEDGRPVEFDVAGPSSDPVLTPLVRECPPFCWELQKPTSEPVTGSGPFPFVVSHCGLGHVVDFDNSFWVQVGHVEGDPSGPMTRVPGEISLLERDLAVYREDNTAVGSGVFTAQLARYRWGPKYIWQWCV